MTAMYKRGWFVILTMIIAGSALAEATSSAGADDARSPVQWDSLFRSARARLATSAWAQERSVAPQASTVPVTKTVVSDTTGDVPLPQGDIEAAGFGRNATHYAFSVDLVNPADPRTDPRWRDGSALAGWAIDTDPSSVTEPSAQYAVVMLGDGSGGVEAGLYALDSDSAPCLGSAIFTPGVGYKVVLPMTCSFHSRTFRMQAAVIYAVGSGNELDTAPNNDGFSDVVAFSAARPGYWLLGGGGQTYSFGLAGQFGGRVSGAASIASIPDGRGYWIFDGRGRARPFGDVPVGGSLPLLQAGERITASATTQSGSGYWMFSNFGRVFARGDADSFGDMSGTRLNGPIIAATATSSGRGYYMLGSDGGVFTFGDARFGGSLAAAKLNGPVVDIAAGPGGYWIFAADGGVFSFDVPFHGSMGGTPLNAAITAGAAVEGGYLLVGADGGVFNFSNLPFAGSLGAMPPASGIIDVAAFTR
jgi:hypothetical protein